MSKIPVIFYKNFPPLYTKLKIGDNGGIIPFSIPELV